MQLASAVLGEYLPKRPDSMFIHPDTMQCCELTIAQPVVVRNLDSQGDSRLIWEGTGGQIHYYGLFAAGGDL